MSDAFVQLFTFAPMVEDALRLILKDGTELDELDFDNMTLIPNDWVPDGPRYAELMWSIPLRAVDPHTQATHVLLLLKFTSTVVPGLQGLLDRHAASLHREVVRRGAFGAPVAPPLIKPVVIYNGAEPWDAPGGRAHPSLR